MKTVLFAALVLCVAAPTIASATEAQIVIGTHHRHHHHHRSAVIINDEGHRLHHRHHGTVAFYDHGRRHWHRHHRPDSVTVTGSIQHRHHRPVVVEGGTGY
ncbi:hypothetical protein FJ987_27985 [Mesorhizobium sp. CU2]|uniref:hypothetical protein n=1 Tax=unclassified Mesorhizobium TaxID=325217 RepID=UPI00112E5893|nr:MULTISPECIES: hypothetical protein [unclassified Mesorhizobium]TPN76721.1 hypothetical protein FJ988_27620 [Mesorhizobium sp. CU3]TPO03221.1 hypothetical protein FJ987_27985 [Mesorhizobium sp. CU2]